MYKQGFNLGLININLLYSSNLILLLDYQSSSPLQLFNFIIFGKIKEV